MEDVQSRGGGALLTDLLFFHASQEDVADCFWEVWAERACFRSSMHRVSVRRSGVACEVYTSLRGLYVPRKEESVSAA